MHVQVKPREAAPRSCLALSTLAECINHSRGREPVQERALRSSSPPLGGGLADGHAPHENDTPRATLYPHLLSKTHEQTYNRTSREKKSHNEVEILIT